MPAKASTRRPGRAGGQGARSTKSAKASRVGSPRREAKASSRPANSGRRSAQGIGADPHTHRLDSPIHAKKDTERARSNRNAATGVGKVAVSTPNVPGHTNFVDATKYGAMKDILLKVMPRKAPGLTQGEMFDAVREAAPNSQFPGSTHRWWAKCVQLDLETKGVLIRETASPLRWRLR